MENRNLFDSGRSRIGEMDRAVEDIGWNPHPTFKGVFMKHVVTGADTKGRLSCHLVRIDPGCEIGDHIHAGKLELHEVINGRGQCRIGEETVDYAPGMVAYIPDDMHHRVTAGETGLELLAKFSPALI